MEPASGDLLTDGDRATRASLVSLDGSGRIRYVYGVRPEDIRAYQKRWERLAAYERDELGRMTPVQKFADLATLMGVARALGGSTHTDEEVEQVRQRWNLLVERLCG